MVRVLVVTPTGGPREEQWPATEIRAHVRRATGGTTLACQPLSARIDAWYDPAALSDAAVNPAASAVARHYGNPTVHHGPVVFTGPAGTGDETTDLADSALAELYTLIANGER